MNPKNRILSAALALLQLFLLCACSQRGSRNEAQPEDTHNAAVLQTKAETETMPEPVWPLLLVNQSNAVPNNYRPPLLTLANGQRIDARIYDDLQAMFDAARRQGFELTAAYCYRSNADQREILRDRIAQHMRQGMSREEATKEALKFVAKPGHSEHELGLAIDINAQGTTKPENLFAWLRRYAWRFGFIERYPKNKVKITGISFERWHYRYVGREAAKIMFRRHLALEEYWQYPYKNYPFSSPILIKGYLK